jgi:fission process protein 1
MAGNDSGKDSRGAPPTGLPAVEKLPASLQKIVDKSDADENFYDELYEGRLVLTHPYSSKPGSNHFY